MSFKNNIQNLINSFDQGTGSRIMKSFLLLFVAIGTFVIYAHSQYPGLKSRDAMESAQIARNLATGNGFTTKCIRPTDIPRLNKDSDIYPETRHAPLYPLLLSVALKIIKPPSKMEPSIFHRHISVFAADQRAIIPITIILSIATAVIIFLIGCRLFNTKTGMVAAGLYLLTESVLYDGISGTSIPLVTFLATSASLAAIIALQNKTNKRPIYTWIIPFSATAILCGLAYLTEHTAIALLPAVGIYIGVGLDKGKTSALIIFAIIFCLTISPWMIRNYRISNNPLGIAPHASVMRNSQQYPDDSFDRSLNTSINNINLKLASAVKSKLHAGISTMTNIDIKLLGGGLIMCFFLVSLFNRSKQQETNLCKWSTALGILILLPILAITDSNESRLLNMFLPMITICGTAFFFESITQSNLLEDEWHTILTWCLILLTALSTALASSSNRKATAYPPCSPQLISYINSLVEEGKTICTDIPWATAWYANRQSILLPLSITDFMAINNEFTPIHGLYITTETSNRQYTSELRDGNNKEWLPILNGKIPPSFPLQNGIFLPNNKHDQIFLSTATQNK